MDDLLLARDAARRLGFRLVPYPPTVLDTVELVETGVATSRALADERGLTISGACQRLREALGHGLLERDKRVGGDVYRVKP